MLGIGGDLPPELLTIIRGCELDQPESDMLKAGSSAASTRQSLPKGSSYGGTSLCDRLVITGQQHCPGPLDNVYVASETFA